MPYAFLDAGGAPVEILTGQAFTTPKLKIGEDEVEHYRALVEDPTAQAAIVAGAILDQPTPHAYEVLGVWTEADFEHYQVQNIGDAAVPGAGQMYASRDLVVTDGVISVHATYAPIPLEEAVAQQLAAASTTYDEKRQSPMSWNFGAIEAKDDTGASHGAAGVQTLQMRDTPDNDDLKNWLAAAQGAFAMQVGGAGAAVLPLKSSGNVWIQTTAAEVVQVLLTGDGAQTSALARGQAMLAYYGAVKAQINAAADTAACLAIDVTVGWPA